MTHPDDDTALWVARAPEVPDSWFVHHSQLHGVRHTQRVHVHAQRLLEELEWGPDDARLALCASLWHDIGRTHDGVEPPHGAQSAARADELGLTAELAPAAAAVARFAVRRHSLPDRGAAAVAERLPADPDPARRLAQPERALRILWLLKDADALDRIRLGFGECADPAQLRHLETVALLPFASRLLTLLH